MTYSNSLKSRLLAHLRKRNEWVNGGDLERAALNAGFKSSNASRRCRELENEGLLERKIMKHPTTGKRSVWYKATPPKQVQVYTFTEGPRKGEKIQQALW